MRAVNIADLKNNLSRYLNEVRAGQEILVRDRRLPIARIVPLTGPADLDAETQAQVAAGQMRLEEGPLDIAALLALDHACLGHAVRFLVDARYLRNGKLTASSSARPCSLVVAVVVMVMSMPRNWSIWSYWISGKMICSFTPRV